MVVSHLTYCMAQEQKTYPIRLTPRANDLLRASYHYRGDLSSQLASILEVVNLSKVELHRFPTGRAAQDTEPEDRPTMKTSVRLDVGTYDAIKSVAERRDTSVNVLLNSAILTALATL